MPDGIRPRYGSQRVFGPFFRYAYADAGTSIISYVLASGELWGRAPRGSDIPAVQAYNGHLPDGRDGFDFYAFAEPDSPYGPIAHWRKRDDDSVRGDDEWAKVNVVIRLVRQDIPWPP